ncbi:PriCT-2 domain-containing protein [Pseudoalteromonas sp. Hal040]|uniref:PriCT-2 domain-containing protein n=1 Tax=unclassified Pseudoalteromonas TaxID=194690 RepID=UPI00301CAAE4
MQQATLQDVQDALQYLDPNLDRDTWVRIAMGIKNEFADAGFDIFDSWSAGGERYKASDVKSMWRSVKAGGGVTIGTVIGMAKEKGFTFTHEPMTAEQQAKLSADYAKRAKEREAKEAEDEAARQRWHGVISDFSKYIIDNFTIPIKSNKYLSDKKVNAYGVLGFKKSFILIIRDNFTTELVEGGKEIKAFFDTLPSEDEGRDFSFLHIKRGSLAIPLIDINKQIWNIQVINNTGTKLFLKHGRKSGLFHFIGKASSCNILAVCEGYATGASIHMATGWPCAVALDAGNLLPVALAFAEKLKDKTFLFCADNDVNTKGNPGITKANEAAAAVNGLVAAPDFSSILNKEAA